MPAFTSIVIKLALVPKAGEDAPLFRRLSDGQLGIPLNAINPQSVHSDVSEKLKHHAVLLSSGSETELDQVDLSKYKITLHYQDKDNDKILISNDGDLYLGIREHAVGITCVLKVFATIQTKQSDKAVQKSPNNNNNNMVVALADLIASTAIAANAGVDAAVQATVSTSKDGAKVARRTAKKSLQVAKSQVKAAKSQVKAAKALSKVQVQAAKAALKIKPALPSVKDDTEPKPTPRGEDDTEPKPAPPPFIHGRHTCDGCLETPILGTRYHATNMPDYDLCSKCHDNYKGTSITFEPAQLDRDAPFQERWTRKYSKLAGRCGPPRRGPPHRGGRRCGRFGGPTHRFYGGPPHPPPPFGHGPPPPPPFGHGPPPPPPPFGHGPPPPPFAPHDPPPMNPAWPTPVQKDWALEQAIKLSLQEQEKQEEPKEQEPPVAPEEPDIVVESRVKEDEIETFSDCLEEEDDDVSVQPSTDGTFSDNEVSTKEETDEEEPKEEKEAPEPKWEEEASQKKQAAVEAVVEEVIKDVVEEVSSHVSGDLMEFVGETLDRVGHAIEGLNHELSKNSSHDGDEDKDHNKIVDGDEDDDDVSKGSWSVVGDDEAIARAAQTIGSSLFNSDNNVSTISNSQEDQSVSSLGTVPTVVPSVSTTIPVERWGNQLAQLHALGFHDDAKLIEILELLEAANIGVDSDDDVSVTQVVDKLLKDW